MTKNQSPRARFLEKVDKNGPVVKPELGRCWVFTSSIGRTGCGRFYYRGKSHDAYRIGYELFVRKLASSEHLHHLCEFRACVNWESHLQVTTPAEHFSELTPNHIAYRNKRKTHCPNGHLLSSDNLKKDRLPYRICRTCANLRTKSCQAARRLAARRS